MDNAVVQPMSGGPALPTTPASAAEIRSTQGAVPIIARSVGAPLHVAWVTATVDAGAGSGSAGDASSGAASASSAAPAPSSSLTSALVGDFLIRSGIHLGDISVPETVFAVRRTLVDLMQFRLAYTQANPYICIGELAADQDRGDADEVLAFVHIVVNNPSLCDSVLTWHLLTTPREELSSVGLPSAMALLKSVVMGGSVGQSLASFFSGVPEIPPRDATLKIETLSPAIVNNEALRDELFAALDSVACACDLARAFAHTRAKFSQRGQHWERLRQACHQLVATHVATSDASAQLEVALRDMASDGAVFWPWTLNQVIADERLRAEGRPAAPSSTANLAAAAAAATSSSPVLQSRAPSAVAHPSIRLGQAFLACANLTENVARQTAALDLSNLITVVTLMTRVDLACAASAGHADEYFRTSSVELRSLVGLLKTIKELAATATLAGNAQERELRQQLAAVADAARAITAKVREMQEDMRVQMQSVRLATHAAVTAELERWATGQRYTWMGAAVLAAQVRARIASEIDGGRPAASADAAPAAASPDAAAVAVAARNSSSSSGGGAAADDESLPMFVVAAGESRGAYYRKEEVVFGPPVLDDTSMAFNLTAVPRFATDARSWFDRKRAARSAGGDDGTGFGPSGGGGAMLPAAELRRIVPQPRRERAATTTSAVRLATLDDPFARA
jgi:hypothetical protein